MCLLFTFFGKQERWLIITRFKITLFSRNNHLTKSRWPNEYDQIMTTTNITYWLWPTPWQRQTLFIEYDQNWHLQTLSYIWGPPYLCAWCFFLVEEQSDGACEAPIGGIFGLLGSYLRNNCYCGRKRLFENKNSFRANSSCSLKQIGTSFS